MRFVGLFVVFLFIFISDVYADEIQYFFSCTLEQTPISTDFYDNKMVGCQFDGSFLIDPSQVIAYPDCPGVAGYYTDSFSSSETSFFSMDTSFLKDGDAYHDSGSVFYDFSDSLDGSNMFGEAFMLSFSAWEVPVDIVLDLPMEHDVFDWNSDPEMWNWDSIYSAHGRLHAFSQLNGEAAYFDLNVHPAVAPEPLASLLFVFGGAGLLLRRYSK